MDELESVKASLGRKIKELRVMRNYSQENMADITGLNRAYISALENGNKNVTVEILAKIALFLEVPLAELFEAPKAFSNDYSNEEIFNILFVKEGTFSTLKGFLNASVFGLGTVATTKGIDILEKIIEKNKKSN